MPDAMTVSLTHWFADDSIADFTEITPILNSRNG